MEKLKTLDQKQNLLSVIVACYNVSEYLNACLDSLANQTFQNIEVIMIDDASEDDTSKIIDTYASKYKNFTAIHNNVNVGPSASRNKGIQLAQGKWLAFVDGDDIVPPNAYEVMLKSLIKSNSEIATGFVRRFDKKRNKPSYLHKKAIVDDHLHSTFEQHSELLYDTTSWNKIYSLALLREYDITFPVNQIYEDVSFTLNAFLHSKGIDILTTPVYQWRWRDSVGASFTQVKNELPKYLDRLKSLNQARQLLTEANLWRNDAIKSQLIFKLLDVDIPLFMNDIADADESFIYSFQEETIKFFRKWDLLNSPTLKQLSAKKQYQYYALINGNFDFLKKLSAGYPLDGLVATLERKRLNIPTFHSPKALTIGIKHVSYSDHLLNFKGQLQVGKKNPQRFLTNSEIINIQLENIDTKQTLDLQNFSRPHKFWSLHLKGMDAPNSRFNLSFNIEECIKKLGIGTYKVKINYLEKSKSKPLYTYLGQPKKKAGSISPFTINNNAISVMYSYNTNWETVIRVIPTTDLSLGSTSVPTVVNSINVDDSGALHIKGSSSETQLSIKMNDLIIPAELENSSKFEFKLDPSKLSTFFNQSIQLIFKNMITGLEIIPIFNLDNPSYILNKSLFSLVIETYPGKGLWIKPDAPLLKSNQLRFNSIEEAMNLELELDNPLVSSSFVRGSVELLSTNLVNRYLDGGSITPVDQKLVVKIPLSSANQLKILSGNYHIYVALEDSLHNTHRFKIAKNASNTQSDNYKSSLSSYASSAIHFDDYGILQLAIHQKKAWIDRTKIRRSIAYSILYPLLRLLPLKNNTVLFESLWGQSYSDSPRAMYQYLYQKYPTMKFVWVLTNDQIPVEGPAIRVRRMSFKYWYYMARAKFLVQNTNFPTQYSKRKGQIEVETLHGTFMKVMGFDEPHFKNASNRVQQNFAMRIGRWDLMSVPSDFMLEHGSTAFDYPEQKILKTGFPRTDELIHNNNVDYLKDIKNKLNIPKNKKIALYAPTYRTTDEPFNFQLDLEKMQQQLSNEYVLLVRLHYFVSHSQNFVNQAGFVYDVSDYNNINDLYLISDVLITDYSSVMFDYGYLKKTMIFFAYDKDWYLDPENRGIYMDYDSTVPGPVALTTEDVISSLQHLNDIQNEYSDKLTVFYDRFCQYGRNGDASERLSEAMLNLKPKDQLSVVNHLVLAKIQHILKLDDIQTKILNVLGQILPKSNIVIFESFFGRQYSDNPKAIYEYMKVHYPNFKLYWNVNKEYESYFIEHNIPHVIRFSFKGIWKQARAKYWFTNVRRPFRWFKPKDTIVVQTWHGTPLKTIGTDVQQVTMPGVTRMQYHKQVIRDSTRWDFLLTPNAYSYEIMHRAFRKQYTQLLPTGYPRNDRLSTTSQSEIDQIKNSLNINSDSKVVLYAPTWRDNEFVRADHYKAALHLDLNKFIKETPDNTLILIRTHYLIANNLDLSSYGNRVINVSDYEDISDLYLISDLLITDYSSVFFDYSILKRPIIFFAYDLQAYANDIRGFYLDYQTTVPGPIVENNIDLIPLIKQALNNPQDFINNEQYNQFLAKFTSWEDGHATERLLQTVLDKQDAYHLEDIKSISAMAIGDQIKIKDGTILWSGVPGIQNTSFIENFDDSKYTSKLTIKRIVQIVPKNFQSSRLYTGNYWINSTIQNKDIWFVIDNVIQS